MQAESAWRMMTARDPYVNVMRGASAAFSAGLGEAGVDVLPHTLAAGLPDGFARRLARNAQLILLRGDSNLGFVADPAAGAGVFEAMTRALCDKSWQLFRGDRATGRTVLRRYRAARFDVMSRWPRPRSFET